MVEPEQFIKHVPWDSEFFGYKVAQLSREIPVNLIGEALGFLKLDGYRLVYFSTQPGNSLLERSVIDNEGFLADQKVTFSMELLKRYPINEHVVIANSGLLTPELLDIVLQTGIHSRYNTDPHFGKAKYEELYTLWIVKSLRKELADEVLLYLQNGIAIGYLTLQFTPGKGGSISLVGVDSHQQGKGIGKELLGKAVNLCLDKGYNTLEVATQACNTQACRFYKNFGFTIARTENIYHFWLK